MLGINPDVQKYHLADMDRAAKPHLRGIRRAGSSNVKRFAVTRILVLVCLLAAGMGGASNFLIG